MPQRDWKFVYAVAVNLDAGKRAMVVRLAALASVLAEQLAQEEEEVVRFLVVTQLVVWRARVVKDAAGVSQYRYDVVALTPFGRDVATVLVGIGVS
jgi:hypothetical protein